MRHENLSDCHAFILKQNLRYAFFNSIKLLQIFITIPVTTSVTERCFSPLKRIKTFLRSSTTNQRLTALARLSIEKAMITEMKDFDSGVVNNLRVKGIGELTLCVNKRIFSSKPPPLMQKCEI